MRASEVPIIRGRAFGTTTRMHSFPDATLTEIRYAPGALLPEHEHASHEFVLTVAGGFQETIARRRRTCQTRRLIYRPAGERHSQRFLDSGAICFAIEPSRSSECGIEHRDGTLDAGGRPTLLAMRLHDELLRPSTDTPLVVEEVVALLLAAGTDPCHARERAPQWLQRTVDMVEARLATTIRLRDLAAEVDRHPVHVSRCFQRHFGCPVAEFVRRRRVHEACRRLRETRESLSAIAAAVGFSDQSHMGRAFRAVMGRSPGSYTL